MTVRDGQVDRQQPETPRGEAVRTVPACGLALLAWPEILEPRQESVPCVVLGGWSSWPSPWRCS
jgi:hypothetical protein